MVMEPLSRLLATLFRLFTHVLLCMSVSPWHMCFYTGRYILCCFDIEEAMVALLKTLSPLQITEVETFTRYLTDKIMQRKKKCSVIFEVL